MWGFLTFFVPFLIFKYFWSIIFLDIIWIPLKCNELIQIISKPYEVPISFSSIKEVENGEGMKSIRIPHILCILDKFSVFLKYDFFRAPFEHPLSVMNSFKKYLSHMKSQKNFKTLKKWRMRRVQRMWGFLTFFIPFLIFNYFLSLIFPGIIWTPLKCYELI